MVDINTNKGITTVDETDKKIIRLMAGDFPLVEEPYKKLAVQVGLTEEELLTRIQNMVATKKIRKMGAVLRHGRVGFAANALCVWQVPKEAVERVALNMSQHPAVSHCYERIAAPDWPYNLYTMIHAHSRAECEAVAEQLGKDNALTVGQMLYSRREWKKVGLNYFAE